MGWIWIFFNLGRQATNYCWLQNIGNSRRAERRASPTPLKQYTPYNFTNITPFYINSTLFYSLILEL
jgi:hypothetical protein